MVKLIAKKPLVFVLLALFITIEVSCYKRDARSESDQGTSGGHLHQTIKKEAQENTDVDQVPTDMHDHRNIGDETKNHEKHNHAKMIQDSQNDMEIGVEEKLGDKIPLDISFVDEHNTQITIGELLDKPTIILPVYYTCPQACSFMLGSLSQVVNDVPIELGKNYNILSFSFDWDDDPVIARGAKNNYTRTLKKKFPDNAWRFLTGTKKNIHAFTNAIGYTFKQMEKHVFIHPNAMVVVAQDGTIIRYLYFSQTFLPFDVAMAVTEAEEGSPSLSIRKMLSYCFSYEPKKKSYTFRLVRVLSLSFLVVMGVGLFFILRRKNG